MYINFIYLWKRILIHLNSSRILSNNWVHNYLATTPSLFEEFLIIRLRPGLCLFIWFILYCSAWHHRCGGTAIRIWRLLPCSTTPPVAAEGRSGRALAERFLHLKQFQVWLHVTYRKCQNQGTIGCTPNSVPTIFLVFSTDSWGL